MPGSKLKDEPGTWSHWDPDTKTFSECSTCYYQPNRAPLTSLLSLQPSKSCSEGDSSRLSCTSIYGNAFYIACSPHTTALALARIGLVLIQGYLGQRSLIHDSHRVIPLIDSAACHRYYRMYSHHDSHRRHLGERAAAAAVVAIRLTRTNNQARWAHHLSPHHPKQSATKD
jgi:hypothetical protein